jgi:dienelactone hydrolase
MHTSLTRCLVALFLVSPLAVKAELPLPSGKFGVGVCTLDWTDEARPETQSGKDGDKRRLLVYLFYPTAKNVPGIPADYFPHLKQIEAFEEQFGKDFFKKSYGSSYAIISRLKCHAIEQARPVTEAKRFPVVIFSHGGGMPIRFYTAIIENLVSHGYVVAAVEHCHDGASVVFPDGHIITQSGWDQDDKRSKAERARFHQSRIRTGALDNRFVLDQLQRLDSGDLKGGEGLLRGRLDLTRVGALGHSFGGKVSIASVPEDRRIRFAMNLGGGLDPGSTYGPLHRPVAAMFGDNRKPRGPNETEAAYAKRKTSRAQMVAAMKAEYAGAVDGSYFLLVDSPGFTHFSYYDFPDDQADDPRWRATPEQWQHNQRLILDSILAVFNAQLDWGERRPMADLPQRFPEIALEPVSGSNVPQR